MLFNSSLAAKHGYPAEAIWQGAPLTLLYLLLLHSTGATYGPAPDLDHANEAVRQGIQDWLSWLAEEVGYECWRLDFVKGCVGAWSQPNARLHLQSLWLAIELGPYVQ